MHTDDWAAYHRLIGMPDVNAHQVVVHAHNFVDRRRGVHMQEVESFWSQLKLGRNKRVCKEKISNPIWTRECGDSGEGVVKM